ncbi:MAG: hypothetical protein MAG453_00742 [Calditrichaeota bacterium]|nr:hypothetical protein [Calditrichota bacterium]
MCNREGLSLQRGMNFRIGGTHSVILMSVRPNAPYQDRVEDAGSTLIYEGHDAPKSTSMPNPKLVDQPEKSRTGRLTENGKFLRGAQSYKAGVKDPELVRVYEKIKSGIWSYNGLFRLIDAWTEFANNRRIFKFKLRAVESELNINKTRTSPEVPTRMIPTNVKREVWRRDGGKCVVCGSDRNLHFDHVIPWSKGGSSITASNIQLLCAKHNIEKRDRII